MTERSDPLFTPAFITLTLSELAYFLVAGLIIGVTPFFVTGPMGSDRVGLGIVTGAFGVTTLALRPFAGRLTDRRGRRPMLLGGSALMVLVVLGHIFTTDYVLVIGLRLLYGVAEALYFVAAFAALADLAPPGRTGEALSYNSLALYVGLALGPLAGEFLLEAGGFDVAWAGGVVLALLAFVLATRIPETSDRSARAADGAPPVPLIHRAAIAPGIALCAGVAAMSGYLTFAGLHARNQGIDAWSLTFLLFGGLVVGLRILFARLPDRVPPVRLGAIALSAAAAGLATTAVVPGLAGLVVGTAGLAVGVAFMTPAMFTAIMSRVPAGERGAAAGTGSLFIDLGFTVGPVALGWIAGGFGIPAAFAGAGAIALAGAVFTVIAPRFSRQAARAT